VNDAVDEVHFTKKHPFSWNVVYKLNEQATVSTACTNGSYKSQNPRQTVLKSIMHFSSTRSRFLQRWFLNRNFSAATVQVQFLKRHNGFSYMLIDQFQSFTAQLNNWSINDIQAQTDIDYIAVTL
jgi:hypothetical protein